MDPGPVSRIGGGPGPPMTTWRISSSPRSSACRSRRSGLGHSRAARLSIIHSCCWRCWSTAMPTASSRRVGSSGRPIVTSRCGSSPPAPIPTTTRSPSSPGQQSGVRGSLPANPAAGARNRPAPARHRGHRRHQDRRPKIRSGPLRPRPRTPDQARRRHRAPDRTGRGRRRRRPGLAGPARRTGPVRSPEGQARCRL